MRHRARTLLAIGAVAAITLAACGSDDKADTATTTAGSTPVTTAAGGATTTAGSATTTAAAGSTPAASTPPASSTDTSELGLIDGVYKGVGGFELDPNDCPEDWNPTQGITDTEIDLFQSLPMSGPLAGFATLVDGAKAYFDEVNANGGIDGRKIVLTAADDGYQPDKTKTNVDEALGENKYAGFLTILGTPNNMAIWDTTNDECMPQLFNGTGAPQWGDVENHPWTMGMQLDYFTEAGLWAKWLQTEKPDLTTVAELTYNSDFGKALSNGFAHAIEGTDIEVVSHTTHEATEPNLDDQFTTMAASGADVLLIETTGAFCTQAMAAVEKQTTWHPLVILEGACGTLSQFFQPLIDQGLTGKDTYLIQTFKDVNDAQYENDPFVKKYHEILAAHGYDPKVTTYATGFIFAWFMEEVLREAATYQGGLDRGNIMLAARNIQKDNPLLIDGLTSRTFGEKDAYVVEGGQMVQYQITDPKTLGSFVPSGELINLEGQLGTYATVKEAAAASGTASTTTTG